MYILYYASIVKELDNCGGFEVALGPPQGLRPACCLPHHQEPKGGVTLKKQVENAGIEPATSEGELTN